MNDRPDAVELLNAVRDFVEGELVPRLSGRERYHARVAANVVAIVAREIECEEDQLLAEWRRLGTLLDDPGPAPARRRELRDGVRARSEVLVERIRAGDADGGAFREAALCHLRRTVADKLEVARPPRR